MIGRTRGLRIHNALPTVTLAGLSLLTVFSTDAVDAAGGEPNSQQKNFPLRSTIAFVSTRDNPGENPLLAAEIYAMDEDGTNPRRLTTNIDGDGFPALSPDGTKIVFDTNRLRTSAEPLNTSHVYIMESDGTEQKLLARGSSASWSHDNQHVVLHASASGTGLPVKPDPGAATADSDIFVINVNDVLKRVAVPKNITNNPAAVDDDPDWSPDGRKIAFTSHSVKDSHNNSVTAEIHAISPDGASPPARLTFNAEEERAPDWSPDGTRILYMCRKGLPVPGTLLQTFEICVMNADGSRQLQLTHNDVPELGPNWSPDGKRIVYQRNMSGRFQLWVMNADGTGQVQLTNTSGLNGFPNWGVIRVR